MSGANDKERCQDDVGEVGLAGFYCGQLKSPSFFIFLFSLIFFKAVMKREDHIDERISAFVSGYQSGRKANPLFGINWAEHWATSLSEMRNRFNVDASEASEYGEGILAEAA